MNREIKFRAWHFDKGLKCPEMLSWEQLNKSDKHGMIMLFDVLTGVKKDIIPMQYTGLKDRNGKEIYEGDIIKNVDQYGTLFLKVIYEGCSFKFEGIKIPYHWSYLKTFEVVGNIFENHELLRQ